MSYRKLLVILLIVNLILNGNCNATQENLETFKSQIMEEFTFLLKRYEASNIELENKNMELSRRLSVAERKINTLERNCTVINKEHRRMLSPPSESTDIAFSTRLTKRLTGLNPQQAVVFDTVVTDTKSAYNKNDGIFTAPLTGMYVFTWTTAVHQYESTALIVDGNAYGYVRADTAGDGDPDYGSASQTVVLKVNRNQHVWIRPTWGSGALDGEYNDNTFSGWLLYSLL